MTDSELHTLARVYVEDLVAPDKKQLRFNDIVEVAKQFYNDPQQGVKELVESCDRDTHSLYTKKEPMWKRLREDYSWMIEG